MKRMRRLLLVLLPAFALAQPVTAQIGLGPQLAWGSDTDLAVGGRVVVSPGAGPISLQAIGSFDWFFDCDDCSYYEITPAVALSISLIGIGPYAGIGANIARVSPDEGESETDVGLALLVGARTPFGLFFEIRNTVGGSDQRVITAGFRLGG
jgi:hypothetical protein